MTNRHRPPLTRIAFAVSLAVAAAWAAAPARAQAPAQKEKGCRDDIVGVGAPGYEGYKFRSVKVKIRFLPSDAVAVPAPGTPYSPGTVSDLLGKARDVLRAEDLREGQPGKTEFAILKAVTVGRAGDDGAGFATRFIDSCVKVVDPAECQSALGAGSPKCVDVSVRAVSLRISTANVWGNLLDNVPRSNRPTLFSKVPGPLLAFNPKFGADHDRAFGPSGKVEFSTNLLDLTDTLRSEPVEARKTRLDLEGSGQKSVTEAYYRSRVQLSLTRRFAGRLDEMALEAAFSADNNPLGAGRYLRNAASVGGRLNVQLGGGPFDELSLGGRYRWSRNRFSGPELAAPELVSENAYEARLLLDGSVAGGFTRLAVWADGGSPGGDAYHRVAGLLGYQKEIAVALNQTVGVELLVGAGHASRSAPRYARFYGGNDARNFLYEDKDSPVITAFPSGPLLRSFGRGQAATGAGPAAGRGGTSYWNVNLNVSLPVPGWSRPLVPDVTLDLPKKDARGNVVLDADGNPVFESRPLREVLKSQGETSRKVLERIYAREGLSPEQAQARARRDLRDINSILAFIADQANIYSVKPLFMFDAARINGPGAADNRTRLAFGAGLQLTVVVATFEAGYVRTVRRLPGDERGNFVMRLFFQNFF